MTDDCVLLGIMKNTTSCCVLESDQSVQFRWVKEKVFN